MMMVLMMIRLVGLNGDQVADDDLNGDEVDGDDVGGDKVDDDDKPAFVMRVIRSMVMIVDRG